MASFRYRAVTVGGALKAGLLESGSSAQALSTLRQSGLTPIEIVEAGRAPARAAIPRADAASRRIVARAIGELAVLLGAELTLDRALAVCSETIPRAREQAAFAALARRVKEGARLSQAMAEAGGLFPPMAPAMAEAGEANGRLDQALGRLADTLERSEAIRRTIGAAMLYPAILTVIGIGVVLTMLLWVIPQFESLFSEAGGALPPMTRTVMGLSRWVRHDGLVALAAAALAGFVLARWLRTAAMRRRLDELVLRAPQLGALVRAGEIGRFARVLGSLVEGGVALPDAVAIARRSLTNAALADAIERVAVGLRQGHGLTASLAGEALFPREALSFVRTGEETARLGPMLLRLADVLDRDLQAGVERAIGVLTPLITVVMGAIVATVIASVMTAILGFNDLALAP